MGAVRRNPGDPETRLSLPRCWRSCRSESFQDWTFRAVVTMAMFRQVHKRVTHRIQRTYLYPQGLDVLESDRLYVSAGATSVPPQFEQIAHLLDGEAKVSCLADETQGVNLAVRVDTIAGLGP